MANALKGNVLVGRYGSREAGTVESYQQINEFGDIAYKVRMISGNVLWPVGPDRILQEPKHVTSGHPDGYLYDCPACDAGCHCTPGHSECVYEGTHNGTAVN
jgi:hypothetical protein